MSRRAPEQKNSGNVQPSSPPEVNISVISVPKLSDINPQSKPWKSVELPRDILLVTVEDPEFLSCYAYLKQETVFKSLTTGLGWVYFGEIGDNKEKVKVCLLRCGKGTATVDGSLIVVSNAVRFLTPKAVICVGFCSGLNRRKVNLGDVVISAKLATYSNKKVTKDGVQSRNIKTDVSRNMNTLIKSAADGWKAPIATSKDKELFEVKVHRDGVILSGPEQVDSEVRQNELLEQYPDAIAIEMQGQGLYSAAFNLQIEWLVVKGISGYADGKNSDTECWQHFASVMAASVVHNILKEPAVLEDWSYYGGKIIPKQGGTVPTSEDTGSTSHFQAVCQEPESRHEDASNENSLVDKLLSLAGGSTDEGQIDYNGRVIKYKVDWRPKLSRDLWVYEGEAWDIKSGTSVRKTGFKSSDDARTRVVKDLIQKLEEEGKIKDQ